MKFLEYVSLAIRTESWHSYLDKSNLLIPELNDRLVHSVIWMQTEVWEIFEALFINISDLDNVDKVNLLEEIWDIMWYLAIWADNVWLDSLEFWNYSNEYKFSSIDEYAYKLNEICIYLLDSTKKSLLYRKEFDLDLFKQRLISVFSIVWNYVEFLWWDLEQICITNIEKLKHRYPEKFTTEKAVNRDLDTERKILES